MDRHQNQRVFQEEDHADELAYARTHFLAAETKAKAARKAARDANRAARKARKAASKARKAARKASEEEFNAIAASWNVTQEACKNTNACPHCGAEFTSVGWSRCCALCCCPGSHRAPSDDEH